LVFQRGGVCVSCHACWVLCLSLCPPRMSRVRRPVLHLPV
jgi:hypothetical protein